MNCPTCKDDDCVESERIDRCSACGWMQVVPLTQETAKKGCECDVASAHAYGACNCICHLKKAGCEVCFSNHQPAPSKPMEKVWVCVCEVCKNDGKTPCPCSCHKPSGEVEAMIQKLMSRTRIGQPLADTTVVHECELRELVALCRKERTQP